MPRRLEAPTFQSSVIRNIHLYHDDGSILGGIYQNGFLTHTRLYNMCPVFLVFPPNVQWHIFALNSDGSTGQQLLTDAQNVPPGRYIILGAGGTPISVSPSLDSYPRRILSRSGSHNLTARGTHFKNTIRTRDGYCMVSGTPNPLAAIGDYTGFHAAHIFPRSKVNDWVAGNFQQFITDNSPASHIGPTGIDSPQNGLLISTGLHEMFDLFRVSINPDDNYRVTVFQPDNHGVDGRTLELSCRNPNSPNRISDDLLHWHFRMAILANMRGAAVEPAWEMDFPDGDMIGEIMNAPHAAERMEAELFERLGSSEEVFWAPQCIESSET